MYLEQRSLHVSSADFWDEARGANLWQECVTCKLEHALMRDASVQASVQQTGRSAADPPILFLPRTGATMPPFVSRVATSPQFQALLSFIADGVLPQ